jgi:predicted glycosyltransferase
VLVHGDPDFVALDASFPYTQRIKDRLRYTGYISSENTPGRANIGPVDILVSAGGSAAGERLIECCIELAQQPAMQPFQWCIRTVQYQQFQEQVRDLQFIRVEALKPDFFALLRQAKLSISQAGYNTVIDLLRTNTAALMIPYEGVGETEQLCRARALAAKQRVVLLRECDLDADSLSIAMQQAQNLPLLEFVRPDMAGVERSVDYLLQWCKPS